jgi:hypothetical protein
MRRDGGIKLKFLFDIASRSIYAYPEDEKVHLLKIDVLKTKETLSVRKFNLLKKEFRNLKMFRSINHC